MIVVNVVYSVRFLRVGFVSYYRYRDGLGRVGFSVVINCIKDLGYGFRAEVIN